MAAMITSSVQNVFQSSRLRYIGVENCKGFTKFITDILNDPEDHALSTTALIRPQGPQDVKEYFENINKSLIAVAICLKQTNSQPSVPTVDASSQKGEETEENPVIIGYIMINYGGVPPAYQHRRTGTIGLSIASGFQNKGYGREAINWITDWGFRHAGLHTVRIETYSFNERAAYLYQDMGFVLDGRKRDIVPFDRKWYDALLFSMTEDEWEALRKEK